MNPRLISFIESELLEKRWIRTFIVPPALDCFGWLLPSVYICCMGQRMPWVKKQSLSFMNRRDCYEMIFKQWLAFTPDSLLLYGSEQC